MTCALRARLRMQWWALGVGFVVLSIDEVAGMHESVNSVMEMSWAVPAGILAGVVGLSFIPFLRAVPRRTAVLFAIGGALYLSGAVGVEIATEGYLHRDELNTLEYNLTTALEEWLEMVGVIVFLYAVMNDLARSGRLRACIDTAKPTCP